MTNFTYKNPKEINGFTPSTVIRSDGVQIPKDPANTDYQAYLEWAKTNTIEEAD